MMSCDSCGGKGWCLETRSTRYGVRRRYECQACKRRWNTIEVKADKAASQGTLLMTERARVARASPELQEVLESLQSLL